MKELENQALDQLKVITHYLNNFVYVQDNSVYEFNGFTFSLVEAPTLHFEGVRESISIQLPDHIYRPEDIREHLKEQDLIAISKESPDGAYEEEPENSEDFDDFPESFADLIILLDLIRSRI